MRPRNNEGEEFHLLHNCRKSWRLISMTDKYLESCSEERGYTKNNSWIKETLIMIELRVEICIDIKPVSILDLNQVHQYLLHVLLFQYLLCPIDQKKILELD